MSDNGDPRPEQQPDEELKAARLKHFQEKPEDFAELAELVIAVRRGKEDMKYLVNNATRNELILALGNLSVEVNSRITALRIQQHMENVKNQQIIKPKEPFYRRVMGK